MKTRDPEKERVWRSNWRARNRDKINAYMKEWRAKHPDKMAESRKAQRAGHPPTRRAYYLANRDKILAQSARWKEANKDKRRDHELRTYGWTLLAFKAAEVAQGGLCLLCGDKKELFPDHGHDTGERRGLLCRTCNLGLGFFKDDPDLLSTAILYLRAHRTRRLEVA